MSRNKLKKGQSYLETCLVRVSLRSVFRKPPDNIFDDLSYFETHFGAILTLEGPWDTFGTRPQKSIKNQQKQRFLDLLLDTLFHQVFFICPCIFKLRFGEPSEPLFKKFGRHFETISGVVFTTF